MRAYDSFLRSSELDKSPAEIATVPVDYNAEYYRAPQPGYSAGRRKFHGHCSAHDNAESDHGLTWLPLAVKRCRWLSWDNVSHVRASDRRA